MKKAIFIFLLFWLGCTRETNKLPSGKNFPDSSTHEIKEFKSIHQLEMEMHREKEGN